MLQTTSKFEALLFKAQDRHFQERRANLEKIYDKFTRPGDASQADYRSVTSVGIGMMGLTTQGGMVHLDEYEMGPEWVVKYKKFSTGMLISEETIDDMRTNKRTREDKVKLLQKFAEDAAEAATWTIETQCTDFALRGASTAVTATWPGTFRDGLALFSDAHVTQKGGVTWSNLQDGGAMTQLSVQEAITMLSNIPSEEGRPQTSVGEVCLMYGRWNEWRVEEILGTEFSTDSDINNINPLRKRKITPLLNPYLPPEWTGYMVVDKQYHELLSFMKQKPTITRSVDPYNGNRINRAVMRFARSADSAKGVVLNPGV
jgi:hypothetical protein